MGRTKFGLQFGMRLKKAREQKNITRKAIANRVGVHTNTYGLYERGNRVPDAIMIRTICDILQVNYIWLFTGEGPRYMPDNSIGLEPELLEKIIFKVEEHLNNSKMILSAAKKAEIISILYEEALEKEEWREQLGIDRKTKRFIKLLDESGSLSADQPFDKRVSDLAREAYFADINNAVVDKIKKVAKSECETEEEIRNEMINELQRDIARKQKQKDRLATQFIVLVVGYLFSATLAVIISRALSGITAIPLSFACALLGLLFLYYGDKKLRPAISEIKWNISASTDLLVGLLKQKINDGIKELATSKAEDTLRRAYSIDSGH